MPAGVVADNFISIGTKCAVTYNIRRYFGTNKSYPMDWWITPLGSLPELIDNGFDAGIHIDNLELVEGKHSVINKRLQVLHHHDFPRDENGLIVDTWRDYVDEARDRNERRARRLCDLLEGPDFNILFIDWIGAHQWIQGAQKDGCYAPDAYEKVSQALSHNFPKSDFRIAVNAYHAAPDPERFIVLDVVDHGDRLDGTPNHVGESIRGYDEAFAGMPVRRKSLNDPLAV